MAKNYMPLFQKIADLLKKIGVMGTLLRSLWSGTVFPLSRFFSANWRFVGARANNFWKYSKQSFKISYKFVKYDIWYTLILDWGKIWAHKTSF